MLTKCLNEVTAVFILAPQSRATDTIVVEAMKRYSSSRIYSAQFPHPTTWTLGIKIL